MENNDLTVISGDVKEVYFVLENLTDSEIESVYFSCADQSLIRLCPYSEIQSGYCLYLSSSDTISFKPGMSRYDLTVRFRNKNDFTVVYESVFNVLEKKNKIIEG